MNVGRWLVRLTSPGAILFDVGLLVLLLLIQHGQSYIDQQRSIVMSQGQWKIPSKPSAVLAGQAHGRR
jgi:hypothetical protein